MSTFWVSTLLLSIKSNNSARCSFSVNCDYSRSRHDFYPTSDIALSVVNNRYPRYPKRSQLASLYPSCEWDPKQIRRLIANGQLAARLKGTDSRLTKTDRECPICFMFYPETNVSNCCNATLCTECYLQIKPPKDKLTCCPFCNNPKMLVAVQRRMDEGDVALREEEEQRMIEATIQNRLKELHGESPSRGNSIHRSDTQGSNDKPGGFGSSLDQYNRSRTFSNSSNASSSATSSSVGTASDLPRTRLLDENRSLEKLESSDASTAIQLLAISPDERRTLESEMRAQLSHDTHRRIESEAEEARMRHVQEWYGSDAGMRSRMREARVAELTALLERLGAANRRGGGIVGNQDDDEDYEDRGVGRGIGAANNLSRLLRALDHSNIGGDGGLGGRNRNLEELMRLEAAFFLGVDDETSHRSRRHIPGRRLTRRINGGNEVLDDTENGEALNAEVFELGGGGRHSASVRGINRLIRNRHVRRGVSSTQLDTAELLMRGVSEEEQLAMAIAMSMQDTRQSPPPQDLGGDQRESPSLSAGHEDQSNDGHPESGEGSPSFDSSSSDSSDESDEGDRISLHHDENEDASGNGAGV